MVLFRDTHPGPIGSRRSKSAQWYPTLFSYSAPVGAWVVPASAR